MDDKLPASSGDFSQGPESYGEISTTLPNNGGVLRQPSSTNPFNRFSSQVGTFTMHDKKGVAVPKETAATIAAKLKREVVVGQEVHQNGGEALDKIKAELEEARKRLIYLENLEKNAESFGIRFPQGPDGSVSLEMNGDLEDPETTAKIKERIAFARHFGKLEQRFELLQPRMSVITDQDKKTAIFNTINTAFESLEWLDKSPEIDIDTEKTPLALDALEELLDQFEILIKDGEKSQGEESLVSTAEKIKLLSGQYTTLLDEADSLKKTLGDDFNLPIFHWDFIAKQIEDVTRLHNDLQKDPSSYTFGAFETGLRTLDRQIRGAQEKARTFSKDTPIAKEPGPTVIAPAKQPKSPSISLDIWSGWPKAISTTKNGVWFFSGEKLDDGDVWARIKTNFDQEMAVYLTFFKGKTSRESLQKIAKYGELIEAKNEILRALSERNTENAFVLLEVFRNRIVEADESWKEYTVAEAKRQEELRVQEEAKKALEVSFKESQKEHKEGVALKNSLFDGIENETEKNFLQNLEIKLSALQDQIVQQMPLNETVEGLAAEYKNMVKAFRDVLKGAENHLKITQGGAVRRAPDTAIVLRAGGRRTTAGEWRREQAGKGVYIKEIGDTKKVQAQAELINIHRENFKKYKDKYKELYLNKTWGRDDPNKDAVEAVFAEHLENLQREITSIKAGIRDKEKDLEEEENKTVSKNVTKILKLTTDLEEARNLVTKLEDEHFEFSQRNEFKERVVSLREHAPGVIDRKYTQTYSPANDSSMDAVGRSRPTGLFNLSAKMDYDLAQRSSKMPGEKNMTDEELSAKRKEESLLTQKVVPNHHEGMVRSVTSNDVHQEGIKHAEFVMSGATPVENAPGEAVILPEPNNEKLLKQKAVKTLLATRFKNEDFKNLKPWQKFAVAIATTAIMASGAGVALLLKDEESALGAPRRAATLGEAVSWTDDLKYRHNQLRLTKNDFEKNKNFTIESFVDDLLNTKQYNFYTFIKKYSPSTTLDAVNAATLTKISSMRVYDLLNSSDGVYGITNEERKDLCNIIQILKLIVESEQKNSPTENKEETLNQLFDNALKIATTAKSAEKR